MAKAKKKVVKKAAKKVVPKKVKALKKTVKKPTEKIPAKGLSPYLCFNGNCREAMEFYRDSIGGKILSLQTFGDAPMDSTPEQKNLVMHSEFKADAVYFMASDAMPGQPVTSGSNVTLSINFTKLAEQEAVFSKLSAGGTIIMPLQETFWGAKFGMFTDKFGIQWMLNCQLKK